MQGLRSQTFMNATQAIKLKICGFDHAHDVLTQRQVVIQQGTQILGRGLVLMVSQPILTVGGGVLEAFRW